LTNLQRGISVLDVDQIVEITLNQMREEFRSSREKRYLTHPKEEEAFQKVEDDRIRSGCNFKKVCQ
jgi:hypothetical protein